MSEEAVQIHPFLPAGLPAAIVICVLLLTGSAVTAEPGPVALKPGETEILPWPRQINPVHITLVFTKFKGEAPGDSLAPVWADQIFRDTPPSAAHFFDTVSFGQYQVTGEYLPRRYELPNDSTYYRQNRSRFSQDLMQLLDDDPAIDFRAFDNNGPDGIPANEDDDGFADYLLIMPMSRPYGFIRQYATGVATLMMIDTFYAKDVNYQNLFIKVDNYSGSIAVASTLNEAIGTVVAELAHAYGAVDLMDKDFTDPESDSAGVGNWDFLGRGALGWDNQTGPAGPCAYNRMLMNSIGYKNENLVDIAGFHENLRLKDVGDPEGKVYRIWISPKEYFLIEHRRSRPDGFFYDRDIPANGLMILHINENVTTNSDESEPLCEIVSPDGLYRDYGYPKGMQPDPIEGFNNLDFWAHDAAYTNIHAGNLGDAGDVYDGVQYTHFGTNTNPSSYSAVTGTSSGVEIFNIHQEGDEMVFDCIVPPFHNWFEERYPFIGGGYHRFSSSTSPPFVPVGKTALYLVTRGGENSSRSLVTVADGAMTVESLALLDDREVDMLVMQRALDGSSGAAGSLVSRGDVAVDEFAGLLDEFGAAATLAGAGEISRVQKISVTTDEPAQPRVIRLLPNYPNPFNAVTAIPYILNEAGPVTLEVYNVLGQKVMLMDRGYQEPGLHVIQLDAGGLASGVYIYRLNGAVLSDSRKFNLLR